MRIFVCGISGRMGTTLCAEAIACGHTIAGGLDIKPSMFPTFGSSDEVDADFDVIIDFSSSAAFPEVIKLAERTHRPAVICTTGLSENDRNAMREISLFSPVFYSENVSLGIGVVTALVRQAAVSLGQSFDVEITEAHHRGKLDSPSGTAKLIANEIREVRPELGVVFNRNGKRQQNEIGITSVRGGTICGEHEIIFAGDDEVLTIKHSAYSRKVFAQGALKAAKFINDKKSGFYTLSDLF